MAAPPLALLSNAQRHHRRALADDDPWRRRIRLTPTPQERLGGVT